MRMIHSVVIREKPPFKRPRKQSSLKFAFAKDVKLKKMNTNPPKWGYLVSLDPSSFSSCPVGNEQAC